MGNETSAPNGFEGAAGSMPPLPPDRAAGGTASAAALAAASSQYGRDPAAQQMYQQSQSQSQQQQQQQQQSQNHHSSTTTTTSSSSSLHSRQLLRNVAKRVERTKANMEKTRTLIKRGSSSKAALAQQQQQFLAAEAAAGEASENGSGNGGGHHAAAAAAGGRHAATQAPLHHHHHQHYPHQHHHPHPHNQHHQHGLYDYQQHQVAGGHAPVLTPSPSTDGPRRSPHATAVVDVMYASEAAHDLARLGSSSNSLGTGGAPPGGAGSGGGSGSGGGYAPSASSPGGTLGAAASHMSDTAAAFAATLSSQMGQLSLSASEAAAVAARGFGSLASGGDLASASLNQPQQTPKLPGLGSLGGSPRGGGTSAGIGGLGGSFKTSGMSNDEDEWKNAWDEDGEESDDGGDDDGDFDDGDEDDDLLVGLGGPLALSAGPAAAKARGAGVGSNATGSTMMSPAAAVALTHHQPFRPAMDGGHSSSASAAGGMPWSAVPSPVASGGYGGRVGGQQPYAAHARPAPGASSFSAPTQKAMQNSAHAADGGARLYPLSGLLGAPAAEGSGGGGGVASAAHPAGFASPAPMPLPSMHSQNQYRSIAAVPSPSSMPIPTGGATIATLAPLYETEEDILRKEADRMLAAGNGAVPWEMSAAMSAVRQQQQQQVNAEKPCVEMFFPMLRVLGKGSFGKVVLVQKRAGKERGGLYAMKILRKSHLVKRRQIERTKTERKVLSLVDHPFIMKLHYAFQTDDKLYLVLDYCPGGELFFHLSRFRRFPERVARFFAAELVLALGHLHKRGIIYRDLKPENVLLDADGHVKLGDFGLAKDKISHPCTGATSMCGTPEYMAPEVLNQQGHGFCVDYWGLGMLTYEMMTGLPPWYTTDRTKLFRRLRSAPLDIPSFFSPQSASFASALLERDPRRRLGVQGLRSAMAHEFFRDIDWSALRSRRIEAPIRPCEGWSTPGNGQPPSAAAAAVANVPNQSTTRTQNQISQNELDVATANFDPQFTRMAVDTEDAGRIDEGDDGGAVGEGEGEETLNEHTFVGFTFDEMDPRSGRGSESGRMRGGIPPDPRGHRSRRN